MRERALAAALILFACPAFAQSDDCTSPDIIVGTGSFNFAPPTTTSSGFDGGGGPNGCVPLTAWDTFWSWNAPSAGTFVFSTCGVLSNSVISLHSGSNCTALCLEYSATGCLAGSVASVTLPANEPVLIQIGGSIGPPGVGALEIIAVPNALANDTCSSPEPIAGLGTWTYTRTGHTTTAFDGGNPAGCSQASSGPMERDLFFVWTATAAGSRRFKTCGEETTPVISVHLGADCAATCVGTGSNDSCSTSGRSFVVHGIQPGDSYLVQVGDWIPGAVVPTDGELTVETALPPPPNDSCATPEAISGAGSFGFDSSISTPSGFDGNGGAPCAGVDHNRDVFFVWTATADGPWQFDTIGTTANARMAAYDGSDCAALCLDFDEDGSGGTAPLLVLNGLLTGDTVLIQIGGWDAASVGPGVLNVGPPVPVPQNSTCDTAEPIAGPGMIPIHSIGAATSGFDTGDPLCLPGNSGLTLQNDLFYQWTATNAGDHRFSMPSNATTAFNIYVGAGCNATCIGSSLGMVDFLVQSVDVGDTFLIQLGTLIPGPLVSDLSITCASNCGGTADFELLCDPANAHFQGGYVTLGPSYDASTLMFPLHLDAANGPASAFGFVLVSAGANSGSVLFNGVLCLDLPMGRYNSQIAGNQGLNQLDSLGQFDANGDFRNISGTAPSTAGYGFDVPLELPFTPPGQTIVPGDTWYFQLWYRDQVVTPGDTANFSNVLKATF